MFETFLEASAEFLARFWGLGGCREREKVQGGLGRSGVASKYRKKKVWLSNGFSEYCNVLSCIMYCNVLSCIVTYCDVL